MDRKEVSGRTSPAIIRAAALTAALSIPLLFSGQAAAVSDSGNPQRGQRVFANCAACHSLKPGVTKFGPSLAGLFGRKAGAVAGFKYSSALRKSGFAWNETTLNRWITNPKAFVPGNRMPFSGIAAAQRRKDLIAYLKQATK